MRKWVGAALLIMFFAGFIPVTKTIGFKINASFFNVYAQLSSPKNWLNWQPELKATTNPNSIKTDSSATAFTITAPSVIFTVVKGGLGNFIIEQNRHTKYSCTLMPDEKSGKTLGIVSENISTWKYLWISLTGYDISGTPLGELKIFMEDPTLYYGFNIQKKFTGEKLILVEKASALRSAFNDRSNQMLHDLNDFIAKNDLKITSPLQLQYLSETPDSLQWIMGLPVNKKAAVSNSIEYMNMPKGKILVGYFNGAYKDRKRIYDAMHQYMGDNYIRPMILPFEVFKDYKLPQSDTEKVSMQLIIPYM